MPLYEYQCAKCGRFEVIRKFSDQPLSICPTCGQEVQKLLSAPAIQFKGTGWYITDYARKGAAAGAGSSDSSDGGSKSSDSGKSSDSKNSSDSTSSPQTSTSKDSPASGSGSSK